LKGKAKIVSVACGWQHTLLLDELGNVYSSGKGDNGELGRGKIRCSSSFDLVVQKAQQISAGKDHSLALCSSKVMGWGNSH
jgi:protein ATS1